MSNPVTIKYIDESYIRIRNIVNNKHYKIALDILKKLHEKSKEIDYDNGINQYFENAIFIFFKKNEDFNAISLIEHLIKKYKKSNNLKGLSVQYNLLGVTLSSLSDYKNSLYYLKKSLEVHINLEPIVELNIVYVYLNLSTLFVKQNKNETALKYLNIALEYTKDQRSITAFYVLGSKIQVLLKLKNYKEARKIYNNITNGDYEIDPISKIAMNMIRIRFTLENPIIDNNSFISYINDTLKLANEFSEKNIVVELYEILKDFYFDINELELACHYANKIIDEESESQKETSIVNLHSLKSKDEDEDENENEEYEVYYKSELDIAANYQQNFHLNRILSKNLVINTLFKPAKILSGDYLGTFSLCNNDNYYLLVLADVVGKGIKTSFISFVLDGIIKSIIYNADSFSLINIIHDINTILSDSFNNQGYVSLWAGIIDLRNNSLESVNAGHLTTYLLKENKTTVELNKGTTILGMFKDLPKFTSEIVSFKKGDSIIAYSDGVTKTANMEGEIYQEKFNDLIRSYKIRPFNFIKYLETELNIFQDDTQIQDDISCLLVEYK